MHIRLRHRLMGGHVHVRLFVGKDADHLQKAGDFVLREDEFQPLVNVMKRGAIEYDDGVVFDAVDEDEGWGGHEHRFDQPAENGLMACECGQVRLPGGFMGRPIDG